VFRGYLESSILGENAEFRATGGTRWENADSILDHDEDAAAAEWEGAHNAERPHAERLVHLHNLLFDTKV